MNSDQKISLDTKSEKKKKIASQASIPGSKIKQFRDKIPRWQRVLFVVLLIINPLIGILYGGVIVYRSDTIKDALRSHYDDHIQKHKHTSTDKGINPMEDKETSPTHSKARPISNTSSGNNSDEDDNPPLFS